MFSTFLFGFRIEQTYQLAMKYWHLKLLGFYTSLYPISRLGIILTTGLRAAAREPCGQFWDENEKLCLALASILLGSRCPENHSIESKPIGTIFGLGVTLVGVSRMTDFWSESLILEWETTRVCRRTPNLYQFPVTRAVWCRNREEKDTGRET